MFKRFNLTLIVIFIFSLNMMAFGQSNSISKIIDKLNKVDYRSMKGRFYLYSYYEQGTKLLLKKLDTKLLKAMIISYIKLFHYDEGLMNLEPFMPYYRQHKASVVAVIKSLASKDEAKDFFLRLDIAEREFLHGNG